MPLLEYSHPIAQGLVKYARRTLFVQRIAVVRRDRDAHRDPRTPKGGSRADLLRLHAFRCRRPSLSFATTWSDSLGDVSGSSDRPRSTRAER
jgi:hypothetical protein